MKGSRSKKSSAVRARSSASRPSSASAKRASSSMEMMASMASRSISTGASHSVTSQTFGSRAMSSSSRASQGVSALTARRSFATTTAASSALPSFTASTMKKNAVHAVPKRMASDHAAVDPQGRAYPTDYKMHLHSPYEMFSDETSTIFDPLVYGEKNTERIVETYAHIMKTLPEECEKTRATITDPTELAAFDAIMRPILTGKMPEGMRVMTAEEIIYDYKQKNKPIPLVLGPQSWGDFFFSEFHTGTAQSKLKYVTVMTLILGSVASLSYDGVSGIMDFFESVGEAHAH